MFGSSARCCRPRELGEVTNGKQIPHWRDED